LCPIGDQWSHIVLFHSIALQVAVLTDMLLSFYWGGLPEIEVITSSLQPLRRFAQPCLQRGHLWVKITNIFHSLVCQFILHLLNHRVCHTHVWRDIIVLAQWDRTVLGKLHTDPEIGPRWNPPLTIGIVPTKCNLLSTESRVRCIITQVTQRLHLVVS